MTDKEIIKALECCVTYEFCTWCPLVYNCPSCYSLLKSALDLIKRQKAEIEDLKEAKEKAAATAMRVIKRQDAEIKRLLTRLTRFNEKIAQPYILINTDAELTAEMKEALRTQKSVFVPDNEGTVIRIDKASIKAEAKKEFAEELIYKIVNTPTKFESTYYMYREGIAFRQNEIIDIIKEMVGEN